jgi:hypothetical protein
VAAAQFHDGGGATGCAQRISGQVSRTRTGDSYALKNYLAQIENNYATGVWPGDATDFPTWPSAADLQSDPLSAGAGGYPGVRSNGSGADLAMNTAATPGSIGYASVAQATASGADFSSVVEVSTQGNGPAGQPGSSAAHDIVWAQVQNNGATPLGSSLQAADPLVSDGGPGVSAANCESNVQLPAEQSPPSSWSSSWSGVAASNPNIVANDPGDPSAYPICMLMFALAWHHYGFSSLKPIYGPNYLNIANTVHDLFAYMFGSTGQEQINSDGYAPIPATSQFRARVGQAVNAVQGASLPAAPVSTYPPSVLPPQAINGHPEEGYAIAAAPGGWSTPANAPVTSDITLWQVCDGNGNNCLPYDDGTGLLDTPPGPEYEFITVRVQETATNAGGSTTVTSALTAPFQVQFPVTNQTLPSISGAAQSGGELWSAVGQWTGRPTSFGTQWERCDAVGNNCADIPDAGGPNYFPQQQDAGDTLRVRVTATNALGSASATSQPTAVIQGVPVTPSPDAVCTMQSDHCYAKMDWNPVPRASGDILGPLVHGTYVHMSEDSLNLPDPDYDRVNDETWTTAGQNDGWIEAGVTAGRIGTNPALPSYNGEGSPPYTANQPTYFYAFSQDSSYTNLTEVDFVGFDPSTNQPTYQFGPPLGQSFNVHTWFAGNGSWCAQFYSSPNQGYDYHGNNGWCTPTNFGFSSYATQVSVGEEANWKQGRPVTNTGYGSLELEVGGATRYPSWSLSDSDPNSTHYRVQTPQKGVLSLDHQWFGPGGTGPGGPLCASEWTDSGIEWGGGC